MPRIQTGADGELVLLLDAHETIRIVGSSTTAPTVVAEADAARPLPAVAVAEPDASEAEPPVMAEPLTAAQAIAEILNAFQQVNVRMREVQEQHKNGTPAHAQMRDRLQARAMDRVVEVCRRYQLGRE